MSKRILATVIAGVVIAAVGSAAFATSGTGSTSSDYNPTASTRILDTRTAGGAVGADKVLTVSLPASVPVTATAVTVNLTVTGGTSNGYVLAYPDGGARPVSGSNVNYGPGQTVGNQATVPVPDGKIDVYNASAGTVQVVVDLEGWYTPSAPAYVAPSAVNYTAPVPANDTIDTGGSAATRATQVGSLTLNPGTYLLTVNAKATPIVQANAVTQISPSFFVYDQPLTSAFTGDLVNFGGNPIESGANANIDAYFGASQIVTITAPNTTLYFYAFGYDSDRGEGTYTLDDLTASAIPQNS